MMINNDLYVNQQLVPDFMINPYASMDYGENTPSFLITLPFHF
jgi:hypothetical protein